jgi:hypothetical protein
LSGTSGWQQPGIIGATIMAEVYFPEDVDNFIRSLGGTREDVLADLLLVAKVGPESLEFCEDQDGLWQYRRLIGPSSYAYLLFAFNEKTDSYIVLHSFRGSHEGATRSDLRGARRKLKAS